jgi:stage III sporulation protein AE
MEMKKRFKIFLIVFLFIFFISPISYAEEETASQEEILSSQKDSLNISSFIKEAQKYTTDTFEDLDLGNLFSSAITGNVDNETLLKAFSKMIGKEVVSCINILGSIVIIIVIHSILKSISEGLENKSISQITYYVQYILIVTLIMKNFADILTMVRTSIDSLVGFMNSLVPLLVTLMLTTGNIASAGITEPIILFIITFIGNFITTVLIPFILIANVLGIVSKVSPRVQVDKLAKFFNSSVVWVLGIVLTIFVGVLSVEGSLSSTVDGITAKTAKAAVTNFIPVVGKILGDAVDTVIGCSNVLKNAVGIVGVIVIVCSCIGPIIRLAVLMALYYLAGAICQPIADEKIVKLLDQMGDTFKMLLAIMCSVSVMLIVGTTLVIKITNSGLMYR